MAINNKKNNGLFVPRVNNEIKGWTRVRITGEGIESKVVSLYDAKKLAFETGLDLIEINTNEDPPIMRVADFSKYMFEQKKRKKEQDRNARSNPVKEVQLSVNTSKNDLLSKARRAKGFIEDGNKVRVILSFRGRELSRREEGKKSLYAFIVEMEDVAVPESAPKDEGNHTIVILKKRNGKKLQS